MTDALFSSPRLWFSEQQKRAVLTWASQLGARDVPSLYALSQCQEHIKKAVGNSATAVTTGTGHKLYLQDIPHLIAKVCPFLTDVIINSDAARHTQDYANPVTQHAMWDYPIDGGGGMSQVFHGSKVHDMPSALVVPTVCVNNRIFFVDELLQNQDNTYFIPERFFYRLPKGAKLSSDLIITGSTNHSDGSMAYEPSVRDLWSLGRKVAQTDVRRIPFDAQRCINHTFKSGRFFCFG